MSAEAFAYLRVSGKGKVGGDGFPRQRAAIKAYADAHNMRIARFFQDEGISGTKDLDDRPALQEMMLAVLSSGVTTILIEKLDRLARDLMVQETLISDFRKHGLEIISAMEPDLCSDDPSRVMVRQLFGIVAQYEKSNIVLKLRSARQRIRAREGKCEGAKPYGAREGEQEVIARIVDLNISGLNYSQIAATLNSEGIKTRIGGEWYAASVSGVLKRAIL